MYLVYGFLWGLMTEAFMLPCIVHVGGWLFSPLEVAKWVSCSYSALYSPLCGSCWLKGTRVIPCVKITLSCQVKASPPVMAPVMELVPIHKWTITLFGCTPLASIFSLLQQVNSVPPRMAIKQTLNHPIWGFIGIFLGLSSCFWLLWIERMVDYFGYGLTQLGVWKSYWFGIWLLPLW